MIRNITQKGTLLIVTEKDGSQYTYKNVSHYAFVDNWSKRQINEREFQLNGGKILIVYTNGKSEFYINRKIKSSIISSNARDAGMATAELLAPLISKLISKLVMLLFKILKLCLKYLKLLISKLVARFGKKRITIATIVFIMIIIILCYIAQSGKP